jgi:hypothetical protein
MLYNITLTLALLIFFQIKHLLIDFIFQNEYQWKNKGTYGHPGGILHSVLHSIATFWILVIAFPYGLSLILSLVDFLVHYHVDWFKMRYNKIKGWTATNSKEFWWLLGIDQFVHQMTYIVIIYFGWRYS